MSLLENAFRWEKKSKLRIEQEAFKLVPTVEEDEFGERCAAWDVVVNGHSAGYVLYCTKDQKFFHLEKSRDENAVHQVRKGNKGKIEDAVISLLNTRYPAEFVEAV